MACYTEAYSELLKRLTEVESLRKLGAHRRTLQLTDREIVRSRALYRGCVVLLSSHIEGFVEDLCLLILERMQSRRTPKAVFGDAFLYHFSKDIVDQIKDTSDPAAVAKKIRHLIARDADVWSPGATFCSPPSGERFVDGFSVPNVENIKRMFSRFGYTSYIVDLQRRLAADGNACTNMVDHVVTERNKIAHGDLGANGTTSDVGGMVKYVRLFCRATDAVVSDWCRSNRCVIR